MLKGIGTAPQHEMEAHTWLRSKQTSEGHWGMAWEYYQCPAYALWPVMRALGNSIGDEKARKRALEYMRSSQLENGSWQHLTAGRSKLPSAELQTALMLSAMQATPVARDDDALQRGVDFLLDRQRPDGSWDGGFFPVEEKRRPKEEYVIATARAICVLNHWRKQP
jgi:squalene-hopene/tetraprenyl-beta-curcumene cyclase